MTNIVQSLIWAGAIIGAALICNAYGVSDAASTGIVMGLTGAAIGTLKSDIGCSRRCPS